MPQINYQMQKIVIIGAGNVATHLSITLKKANFNILQIFSKTTNSAKILSKKINSDYTTDLSKINSNADLYVIAISDSEIEKVIKNKIFQNKFLVHTAGSINIDIFENYTKNYGVFYPLQTFSKSIELDFKKIPLCIEANNDENKTQLIYIGEKISNFIYEINSEQRGAIHLAAIFANNFTNHLFNIASEIIHKKDIPFEILHSLIEQTSKKVLTNKPSDTQTGPAIRGDEITIQKHLKMLQDTPDYQKIYDLISKNISK